MKNTFLALALVLAASATTYAGAVELQAEEVKYQACVAAGGETA